MLMARNCSSTGQGRHWGSNPRASHRLVKYSTMKLTLSLIQLLLWLFHSLEIFTEQFWGGEIVLRQGLTVHLWLNWNPQASCLCSQVLELILDMNHLVLCAG